MVLQARETPSDAGDVVPRLPSAFRVPFLIGAYVLVATILAVVEVWANAADLVGVSYLPSALSLVLLLVGGLAYTPVVIATTLLVETVVGGPVPPGPASYVLAFGPAVAWGLAAAVLRRGLKIDRRLRRIRDVAWFALAAVAGSLILAGITGTILSWGGGFVPPDDLHTVMSWWAGGAIEVLAVAPPLLAIGVPWLERIAARPTESGTRRGPTIDWQPSWSKGSQVLAQAASISVVLWTVFRLGPASEADHLLFLCLLPVIWIALAHGLRGASLGVLGLTLAIAIVAPPAREPFSSDELQLLMLAVALIGLFVGALTSERRTATKALRRERNFVASVLDTVDAPIVVIDRDGRVIRFNRACQRISGYAADEIVGKRIDLLIPAEELDAVRGVLAELVGGVARNMHSNHWVAKDGSRRLIRWTNAVLPAEGGAHAHVIGTGIDVTDLVRAREEVRETESRFRAVFDEALDLLGTLTPDGTVLEINRSASAFGAVANPEAVGRRVWEVPLRCASPEMRARLQAAVAEAAAGGVARDEIDVAISPNRTAIVDVSLKPIKGEDGRVTTILLEGHDVTERKRVQAALEDREARLQSILDTAPIGIIRIDERGTVLTFNRAAEAEFGYAADEIVGRNVKLLMTSADRDRHDDYIGRYLETGEKRIIGIGREVVGQHKDGTTFPIELAVGEIMVRGRRNFTGFVRDISLRREAEIKLGQQQTALAHAMRLNMMGAMASAIAHELNQPLTAITSYAQACLRMLKSVDGAPPELRDAMAKVVAQTMRAGEIVRHVRGFLRKEEPRRSSADLNDIVRMAAGFEAFEAAHEQVTIDLDLASRLPPVPVDRVQIEQVVLNLVRNAVQAIVAAKCEQRVVTVRTGMYDDAFVEVAVRDTGPGIPAEIVKRLFEPFVTARPDGMGMGLSICRSIVDAHRGKLWANPGPDGGTIFRFTLPVTEAGESP